jgi:hypothetical protein
MSQRVLGSGSGGANRGLRGGSVDVIGEKITLFVEAGLLTGGVGASYIDIESLRADSCQVVVVRSLREDMGLDADAALIGVSPPIVSLQSDGLIIPPSTPWTLATC